MCVCVLSAAACDLSQLWLREVFIDRCGTVQFAVESSLPAMLTQHALASDRAPLLQSVTACIDVYNDAMAFALGPVGRPYLFDEVEGECSVVLRDILSKLTVTVYRSAPTPAVCVLVSAFMCVLDSAFMWVCVSVRSRVLDCARVCVCVVY